MNRLRIIYLILLVPVSLTLGASVLIPMVYPEGMLSDLDGIVGAVDHASLWTSMDPFSGTLYCVGDSTCHQMSTRTFILNENQMPFCIREISLIVGLFIGILALVSRPEFLPSRKMIVVGAAMILLSPAQWIVSLGIDIDSMALISVVSVISGVGFSVCLSALIQFLFRYHNPRADMLS